MGRGRAKNVRGQNEGCGGVSTAQHGLAGGAFWFRVSRRLGENARRFLCLRVSARSLEALTTERWRLTMGMRFLVAGVFGVTVSEENERQTLPRIRVVKRTRMVS